MVVPPCYYVSLFFEVVSCFVFVCSSSSSVVLPLLFVVCWHRERGILVYIYVVVGVGGATIGSARLGLPLEGDAGGGDVLCKKLRARRLVRVEAREN